MTSTSTGFDLDSQGGAGGDLLVVDPGEGEGCVTATAESKVTPLYLVFLLDQSGSMGDGQSGLREQKWDPVTDALRAFFSDPRSAGFYASLTLFPNDANKTEGFASKDYPILCDAAAYEQPVIEPVLLPDSSTLSEVIESLGLPNEWGTPTTPALSGTLAYARSLVEEGKKAAVVLVTDGEPAECDPRVNNVFETVDVARAVADVVPTYVIGVAYQPEQLDLIAEAGGTDVSFVVDTDDAEKTRDDLLARFRLIQDEQVPCTLELPDPPDGQELDIGRVNVRLGADDAESTLGFNTQCEGGRGWKYDDPNAPGSIELCRDSCAEIQGSSIGSLTVVFGCQTEEVVIR